MLDTQDPKQRLGRNRADQLAQVIDHRHGNHVQPDRKLGDVLLVVAGPHRLVPFLHDITDPFGPVSEQVVDPDDAHQTAIAIRHKDRIGTIVKMPAKRLDDAINGRVVLGPGDVGHHMRGGRFPMIGGMWIDRSRHMVSSIG